MILKKKKIYKTYNLTYYRKHKPRRNWCTFCKYYHNSDCSCVSKIIYGKQLFELCYSLPGLRESDIDILEHYIYIIPRKIK